MGGGTVAEKIYGTEEGRRKNRIMDSHLTHWGEQTGKVKEGVWIANMSGLEFVYTE